MMAARVVRVLVVDDDPEVTEILAPLFHASGDGGELRFEVDGAESLLAAVTKVRSSREDAAFDIVVLDLGLSHESEGLEIATALAMCERLGQEVPIQIVFTNNASLKLCVQAMRCGAWDFIIKSDFDRERSAYQKVVDSATIRLRNLTLQEHLERDIATRWLPQHLPELQRRYGGKVVAIWHEPEVSVIASGEDAFELEGQLKPWRGGREPWMQPLVVAIPEEGEPATLRGK